MMQDKKLVILCGPSGSGKTTIARHLLKQFPRLTFSISATTRALRGEEVNGKDYHFLSLEDFEAKIENDEFVEFEEVYKDVFYGTLKSELQRIWNAGKIPVLDIDVIGALNIKNNYAPQALTVFVHPLSVENLRYRLHQRATETAESFEKRIHKAEEELAMADKIDHIVYNDTLEHAQEKAEELVKDYLQEVYKFQ